MRLASAPAFIAHRGFTRMGEPWGTRARWRFSPGTFTDHEGIEPAIEAVLDLAEFATERLVAARRRAPRPAWSSRPNRRPSLVREAPVAYQRPLVFIAESPEGAIPAASAERQTRKARGL